LIDGEGGGPPVRTSLTGVQVGVDVTGTEKVWRMFQAIGDIAFAYAYSNVLIEIQASQYVKIVSSNMLTLLIFIYLIL
jgi:hypothetical protein